MIPASTWMRVRVPFRAPLVTAAGTWTARESWIVRAALADGTIAWAEALVEDPRDAPVLEALLDDLVATGLPPAPPLLRRAGAAGRAMASVLDQLTLDPRDLAASLRTGVRVNATLGAGSPDEIAAAVDDALGRGFRTLKLKAGRDEPPDALVARVAAARAAAGDRVAIRLDANGAGTGGRGASPAALAGFGLQFVEQPLPAVDLAGDGGAAVRVGVPVAADEAVASRRRRAVNRPARGVLVVKPAGSVGGRP